MQEIYHFKFKESESELALVLTEYVFVSETRGVLVRTTKPHFLTDGFEYDMVNNLILIK